MSTSNISLKRIDLQNMNVVTLRQMAKDAGLNLSRKEDIVNYFAEDGVITSNEAFDTGSRIMSEAFAHMIASMKPNREELKEMIKEVFREQTGSESGLEVTFPEVGLASCHINGNYVTPPFWNRFKAAVQFGHVELKGPPGVGKTLAVHKLAEIHHKRLAVIGAEAGIRKRDLIGGPELRDGTTYYQASEFAAAAINGDWALIEELNFADADSIGFLLPLLDRPRVGGSTFTFAGKTWDVHPDFTCFITRNVKLAGTKKINEALLDRFTTFVIPPLLGDDLRKMLSAHNVPEEFQSQAIPLVESLWRNWENNHISYQISPRRVLQANELAMRLDEKTIKGFRELLTESILNKIEEDFDRKAVEQRIITVWENLD